MTPDQINCLKQLSLVIDSTSMHYDKFTVKTVENKLESITTNYEKNLMFNIPFIKPYLFQLSKVLNYLKGAECLINTKFYDSLICGMNNIFDIYNNASLNQDDTLNTKLDEIIKGDFTVQVPYNINPFDKSNEIISTIRRIKLNYLKDEVTKINKDEILIINQLISKWNKTKFSENTEEPISKRLNKLTYGLISHLNLSHENMIFSGGLVYDILHGTNNLSYNEFRDIDLFLFGKCDRQQIIMNQINKLQNVYGASNIIVGYVGSVVNIFIVGVPRVVQIINFDGETPLDVINHFDLDYVQSYFYDKNPNSYWVSPQCTNAIKTGVVHQTGNNLKFYRLLKSRSKGFDISEVIKSPGFSNIITQSDFKPQIKQYKQIEYYKQTSNLTTGLYSEELLCLFGLKEFNHEIVIPISKFKLYNNDVNKNNNLVDYEDEESEEELPRNNSKFSLARYGEGRPIFNLEMKSEKIWVVTTIRVLDMCKFELYENSLIRFQITDMNFIKTFGEIIDWIINKSNWKTKIVKHDSFHIPLVKSVEAINKLLPKNISAEFRNQEEDESEAENNLNSKHYVLKYKNYDGLVFRKTYHHEHKNKIDCFNIHQEYLVKIGFAFFQSNRSSGISISLEKI